MGSPHIILIGFMAAGKTTVGRALANILNRPFFDCDAVIEARTGKSVPTLFRVEGEAAFRRYECEALQSLLAREEPAVISCGGGIVMHEASRNLLEAEEHVVWLDAAVSITYDRIKRQTGRPLRENQTLASLEELAQKRRPFYASVGKCVVRLEQPEAPVSIAARIRQCLEQQRQ